MGIEYQFAVGARERGEVRERPEVLSAEDQALVSASPAREVWDFLKTRYAAKGVTLDSNLALDLGLDSLEWMTVALEIEARAYRGALEIFGNTRHSNPQYAPDGQLLSYKFHHRASGKQFLDTQTLAGVGVKPGDILRLQPEITAG